MPTAGIDTSQLHPVIRPQDDLFRHVNGRWLEESVIPPDRSASGAFLDLRDASEEAVRTIIERAADAPDGPLSQAVGNLYRSFMNEERIEAAGLDPIAADLEQIDTLGNIEELIALTARWQREGMPAMLSCYVDNDPGQPDRYLLQIGQAGLGLPDESYYREPHFATHRQKYQEHIRRVLELSGHQNPEAGAERVMALETQLATVHWSQVTMRDPHKRYNLMSYPAALELMPQLELWFAEIFAGHPASKAPTELVVINPHYLERLSGLLNELTLRSWQDWLVMRLVSAAAPYLSTDFVSAHFDFYGTALTGAEQIRERWKRGVAVVEQGLGEAVGQLYVAEHFPPEHKARMEQLVARLLEAYGDSIRTLDWMGEETKARALEKLATFVTKIGYPERWKDYSGLRITDNDLVGNVRRSASYELDRELAKLDQPIDRSEWFMTPQTVNAYYNPVMNEIVFPAAILQPPFFDAEADDAANFGGIGAVIGHEIGHGFDDKGSQYDSHGALRNWWSEPDRRAFEKRTAELVSQYAQLSPAAAPELTVNGELTLGENIGDLGGLAIAYRAWLLALDGAEPQSIDGLSGAQRFFLSWAECWRGKNRHEDAVLRITVDPHSPVEWRCNQVVKNIDAFHEAFGTRPGDGLWLDPEHRVKIW